MYNKLINNKLIKNKLSIIFKNNFDHNYDHRWLEDFISSSYKTFSIYEEFNFNSMSRWRILTTSKTVVQKLFIKTLQFYN